MSFLRYPLNLELSGRRIVVIGGGHVAARKVRVLAFYEAEVTLVAPKVASEIAQMATAGKIIWLQERYRPEQLDGAFIVICATNDATLNRQVASDARKIGALVGAPGEPELADFFVPASFRCGRLCVAVSTDGLSPALARVIKDGLQAKLPPTFGDWLERLALLRGEVKDRISDSKSREKFWRLALNESILELVRAGNLSRAEVEIRNAITRFGAESQDSSGGDQRETGTL